MENTTPNTNNFLNWVEIKNFKSIKDLRLDCKRVNVFIGKPNVGKSNILEGLGLWGEGIHNKKLYQESIRYNTIDELFFDNNIKSPVSIRIDLGNLTLKLLPHSDFEGENHYAITLYDSKNKDLRQVTVNGQGEVLSSDTVRSVEDARLISVAVKKYDFTPLVKFPNVFREHLLAPNGINLFAVIDSLDVLKKEFSQLFKEQQLEFVLVRSGMTFALQKKEGMYVNQYPFLSIADTFRRFMFYITAIESNKNSVIIFEEPEVHSFPPYTQDVAYRIIYSEENQFFVSTHSPYLLQTLVSNLKDDQLNVFVTYYENYETKVKALTPEEIGFVQEYSTDVFFNLDRFVPNAQSANPA